MRFYPGDVVSCGYSHGVVIVGRVVVQDGRYGPYQKVVVVEHPDAERVGEVMSIDHWHLGVGPREGTCVFCKRPCRFEQPTQDACARCEVVDHGDVAAQSADPSRRASSWEHRQTERRMRRSS